MSTSLLYHACGIRGYTLTKTEFSSGMMLFFLEAQPQHCRCSVCGSRDVIRRGSQTRWFRNVPFGTHLTWIVVDLPSVFEKLSLLTISDSDEAFLVSTAELWRMRSFTSSFHDRSRFRRPPISRRPSARPRPGGVTGA